MKSRVIEQNTIPSININLNEGIRLSINGDPNRVISFNPKDVNFTQKFYSLLDFLEEKQKEYEEKSKIAEANNSIKKIEADGETIEIPSKIKDIMQLISDICDELNAEIDKIFGEGTSWTLFEGAKVFNDENNQYIQFFEGITPFIGEARKDIKEKYKSTSKALKK